MCINPENEITVASNDLPAMLEAYRRGARGMPTYEELQRVAVEIESLRKQLEDEKKLSEAISRDCNQTALERNDLRDQLFSLRSSRDAELERAIRLSIDLCHENWRVETFFKDTEEILVEVLAQLKEQT